MTDKELDALIKEALSSDEMPEGLNQRLLARAQKKVGKNRKIIYISKWASSVAAVFICGVAVLSYFNSDTLKTIVDVQTEKKTSVMTAPQNEASPVKTEKEEAEVFEKHTPAAKKTAPQSSEEAGKTLSDEAMKESEDALPASEVITKSEDPPEHAPLEASFIGEEISEEALSEDAAVNEPPVKMRQRSVGSMKAPLFSLFAENYDFKSIIYNDISKQLQQIGKEAFIPEEISGYEEYKVEQDGSLFIIFPEGSIAPPGEGRFEFFVGRLENGILN